MKSKKINDTIICNNKYATIAAFFMLLSGVIRILYYRYFYPDEVEMTLFFGQILLPLFCVLGFSVMVFMKKTKATILPALAGVTFFILKAMEFETLHKILCILLYSLVGIIYTLTVLGKLPNKIPLVLTFALPLVAHIGMDVFELATYEKIVLVEYMPELSVIFIMTALLFFSYSLGFNLINKKDCKNQ